MPRGKPKQQGDEHVNKNGYRMRLTGRGPSGHEFVHRLMMEEHIGRPLLPNEWVVFIDGDRTNLTIENLRIKVVKERS